MKVESELKLAITIPNKIAFTEKDSLVKRANEANIGIFVSDLPQNHDLFQLLTLWKERYTNIATIGTAIISPLVYETSFLIKQIKTLFEIYDSGIELGLGIGDKNLINQEIKNRLEVFQNSIHNIVDEEAIRSSKNVLSIAGSGTKLMNLANSTNSGVIYNGIPTKEALALISSTKTRQNFSSYIMADVNDYDSLSKGYIQIVSRILTGLNGKELQKLAINRTIIDSIHSHLQQNDLISYKEWLPEDVIRKVAMFGTMDQLISQLTELNKLNIKQTIISINGQQKKIEFLDFISKNGF